MKLLKVLALGLVLVTAHVSTATAAMRIAFDPGGVILDYITKYTDLRDSGGKVVIDGACMSACTLVLGLIERENVCITPRALMAFHSAREENRVTGAGKYDQDATRLLWFNYPDEIKELLKAKGWDGSVEQPTFIFVTFKELQSFYRVCP